jgi:hypothetical protein
MQSLSLRDPHVLGGLAASVVCIAGATAYFVFRRRPTPDEIERERRALLVRSGRIIDGTILDISDSAESNLASQPDELRFVLYKYEIGGVVYECSQDISALRDRFRPEDFRLSFPCSVRYDVHRPENSIIVAENWSGLREPGPPRQGPRPKSSAPATGWTAPIDNPLSRGESRQ